MNFIFTNNRLKILRAFTVISLSLVILAAGGCRKYQADSLIKKEAANYQTLGRLAQDKNDLAQAMSYYKKATYLDPYNAKIYNDLAVIYEQKQMYPQAEDSYIKAIEIDNGFLPAYFNLGRLYEKIGDPERAVQYYKKRIELSGEKDKNDPWVWKAKQRVQFYESSGKN
ncbi:MAG: tetratricopeptide repeat protein [Candidatus Omnitrophica bacterium]|nr:tetratricopeptide repeat protein [Candidatus Omnitrophota bacterium]